MSTGIVICSLCNREVHQDGPNHGWQHCEDGTAMCAGAIADYPTSTAQIKGKWCGCDADPRQRPMRSRDMSRLKDAVNRVDLPSP